MKHVWNYKHIGHELEGKNRKPSKMECPINYGSTNKAYIIVRFGHEASNT